MKYSPRIELAFAALLVLTVASKTVARAPVEADPVLFGAATSGMLAAEGFVVTREDRPIGVVVQAVRGSCRMRVREYPADGTFTATFAQQGSGIGPLRFVFRGQIYDEVPKVRPLIEYYGRRAVQRLGLAVPRAPILAIAASPGCDVTVLPWQRIATLPH